MDKTSFALIAHDLKNALGTLEHELADMVVHPDASRATRAHAHCSELKRQFVQFLTLYSMDGGMHAHCEDESPQALLESLLRAHLRQHPEPGHLPKVCLGDTHQAPAFWYVDRRLVTMALDAALHNALRFAHHQVVLQARQDEGYLVFSVDDDGSGLGSMDPSEHSTGLGTVLCKAIAALHQCEGRTGRVSLIAHPEGGTRFELWLP